MFQNNYTENSFLFKGLILKNLRIDEITINVGVSKKSRFQHLFFLKKTYMHEI